MVTHVESKQSLVQKHNFKFAYWSIIALAIIIFLPVLVDPWLDTTSFDTITTYVKISDGLIAIFAILAIYSGSRGLEMAKHKTHKTIYVTAISVGILSLIQFLWMGLPTIFS